MSNKKILYFDPVSSEFKDILFEHKPNGFDLLFWEELNVVEKVERAVEADYLMVATNIVDERVISSISRAKLIQKTGIGIDNIDLQAASKYALPVSNTPGANATGVAELTVLYILALYRKLPLLNQSTKNGKWLMWEFRTTSYEMEGKIHGFIGFGNIGRKAANRSKAFGTTITYYDKFRVDESLEKELGATYLSLEELLRTSDIISLHIPLLPETANLIGEKELNMMKKNAVLINVSRGGTVDEGALYVALRDQVIAGAGIDVWEIEPPHPDNPLLQLENIIASPHIGAGTRDTLNKVLHMAFQNINRIEHGEQPKYVVNDIQEARVKHKEN